MQEYMIQGMKVLRENRHLIISLMDLFVREPLIDWNKIEGSKVTESLEDLKAETKIAILQDKLKGVNPIHLTGT